MKPQIPLKQRQNVEHLPYESQVKDDVLVAAQKLSQNIHTGFANSVNYLFVWIQILTVFYLTMLNTLFFIIWLFIYTQTWNKSCKIIKNIKNKKIKI